MNTTALTAEPAAAQRLHGPPGVDVWIVDVAGADLAAHAALLNRAERERAARFRFDADRARCIVARASLRWLLGAYLGRPAAGVALATGAHGKPELADRGSAPPLRFNSSHSGTLVVHAFTMQAEVGIDVEFTRGRPFALRELQGFLGRRELARIQRLAPEQAQAQALRTWTHKEAFLKALGCGLSVAPCELELEPTTPCPAGGTGIAPRIGGAGMRLQRDVGGSGWRLWHVDVGADHLCSVVRAGPAVALRARRLALGEAARRTTPAPDRTPPDFAERG